MEPRNELLLEGAGVGHGSLHCEGLQHNRQGCYARHVRAAIHQHTARYGSESLYEHQFLRQSSVTEHCSNTIGNYAEAAVRSPLDGEDNGIQGSCLSVYICVSLQAPLDCVSERKALVATKDYHC